MSENFSSWLALIALLAWSTSFILSLASRKLARVAGGWRHQVRVHHFVSLFAAGLISGHVFLEVQELGSEFVLSRDALSEPSLAFGFASLLLFIMVILSATKSPLLGPIWHSIHLLIYPSFVFALVHALLFMPNTGALSALQWLAIVGAFLGFTPAAIGHFWVPSQRKFIVQKIEPWLNDIFEMKLTNQNSEQQSIYPAGSLVALRLKHGGFLRRWHYFTVASCRLEACLRLIVRSVGHDTAKLAKLPEGTLVLLRGPFSNGFCRRRDDEIWITGGVGIAPFVGSLHCRSLIPGQAPKILHFARSNNEAKALHERFTSTTSEGLPSIQIVTRDLIKDPCLSEVDYLADTYPKSHYYICGSEGFMKSIRLRLIAKNISRKQIITEENYRW